MRQQGWIRAGFARTAMKRAAALSPALAQHLRQRLGPTLAVEFDEAPLLGWMPYEIDVAMADGSVRFVRGTVEPRKLAAAITIAGGEVHDLD